MMMPPGRYRHATARNRHGLCISVIIAGRCAWSIVRFRAAFVKFRRHVAAHDSSWSSEAPIFMPIGAIEWHAGRPSSWALLARVLNNSISIFARVSVVSSKMTRLLTLFRFKMAASCESAPDNYERQNDAPFVKTHASMVDKWWAISWPHQAQWRGADCHGSAANTGAAYRFFISWLV